MRGWSSSTPLPRRSPTFGSRLRRSRQDDTVSARVSFRGTHRGEFQGLPPTNREVAFTSVELNRVVNGKVAEHWVDLDLLSMLQQLGLTVIPGPRLLPHILGHRLKKLLPESAKRRSPTGPP
ncbi:MAG: ester cyclase [Thermomicrobiales bacterium]|nr:ester cyclase [Thermomicrobiales bacterium]